MEEDARAIDEVIEPIEASWRRFREALAALPPDGFDRPTRSGWTVKEMLGHVAFWAETVEPVVEGMFRGRPVADGWYGGDDLGVTGEWPRTAVHNAREAAGPGGGRSARSWPAWTGPTGGRCGSRAG